MTRETRTLIELPDITGVDITCSKCGFGAYYPIAKLTELNPHCPQCRILWFDEGAQQYQAAYETRGSSRYPAIDSLLSAVSELRALSRKDRTDLHATIRFRVLGLPE